MQHGLPPQPIGDDSSLVQELMWQLDAARDESNRLRQELASARADQQAARSTDIDLHISLLSNLRQIVFVLNERDEIKLVSGNVIGITGYTAQEMTERLRSGELQGISAEDRARVTELMRRARIGLSGNEAILRFVDRAGEQRWVQVCISSMPDVERGCLWLQGVITDVSEQRRIEHAIDTLSQASSIVQRASLRRDHVLQALTSALSSLGFMSVVLETRTSAMLRVSAHHLTLAVQQAVETVLQRSLTGAVFRLDSVQAFERLASTHKIQRFVTVKRYWRETLPPDTSRLVDALCLVAPSLQGFALPMIAHGQLMGILMVASETVPTPLQPALATFANQAAIALCNAGLVDQLAEREQQYRSIFEATQSGLAIIDDKGIIVQANPALLSLYSPDPLTGSSLETLFAQSDRTQADQAIAALSTNESWRGSATGSTTSNAAFPVELYCGPLWFDGRRHGLVVLDDVTEQVRARATLVRNEKLRALGQMAGGIAHDFNNILVGIRGFADLAMLDVDEDMDALRQDLDRILRGANDATEAVRRLQSLYRDTEDTSRFTTQGFDGLVTDALALTRPRWKDQPQALGHTIRVCRKLSAPPAVLGDGSELRRVVTNLIINAVEAMPHGGELLVETSQVPGYSVLRIADTGSGISSDQLESIFEPFYSTKESSGLGLAIARSIIEHHGGKISVESTIGVGTQFEIRLPWDKNLHPTRESVSDQPTNQAQLTVLVVDDEAAVLGLLSRFLSRAGHLVEAASSGRQALELLDERCFDLLVTDLGMPDVSGYEIIKKAHASWPDMPIILSTGWGDSITPARLRELHAAALLSKPFTHKEVTAALTLALDDNL